MPTNKRNATSEGLRNEVLAKIKHYEEDGFPEASRIHELIMQANPTLHPRIWYGMPGYAKTKDSAVLCFFRKDEFVTFGITESVDITSLTKDSSSVTSSWFITNLDERAEELIQSTVTKTTQ